MRFLPFLVTVAAFAAVQARGASDDWLQWRGPTRDGVIHGKAWPASLKEDALKQMWRVELEPSYSGPIVSGERVFVTETVDKKSERVRALERATGKELWRREWEGAISVPFFAKSNGDWIRATPACDGEQLYVVGIRDVVVCLDVKTGEERWRFDFPQQLKTDAPSFGAVCSPLLDGDALYIQAGNGLCRLDKRTGKLVWRTLDDGGGMMGGAFSSPLLATLGGQKQLVVQTRAKLAGVNPKDGAVLWQQEIEAFRGMNILTPIVLGDLLLTSTYGGKTIGWRVQESGGKWSVTRAWEHKSQGYMTTPVVVKGTAFTHLRSQRAMAIDVASGAERWTTGEGFGKYWSIVANGDRLLALDERGTLYLLAATPEKFQKLDERKISKDETWAHLAVSGSELFVRELKAITAWHWGE